MSSSSCSTTSPAGLRWLDILEKEFDKSFVDLTLLLDEIDVDQSELTFEGKHKLTALSAAFAQLTHKTHTLCQTNSKLEAQLLEMRSQLSDVHASKAVLEKELHNLLLQLHAAKLQVLGQNADSDVDAIKKKLEQEMERYREDHLPQVRLESEMHQLKEENVQLRRYMDTLHSELYGARLASKYLDKELAGRIQQIQLLGRDMRGSEHDKLWGQLEAEIHLHRHKTVIQACRGPVCVKKFPLPPGHDSISLKRNQGIGTVRLIQLHKDQEESLGMSITGGKEHGVPIVISQIHKETPADNSKALFVGDTIISVNGIDLRDVKHQTAVNILSKQEGDITLQVIFVTPDDDSDNEMKDINVNNSLRPKKCKDESPSHNSSLSSQTNETCSSSSPLVNSVGVTCNTSQEEPALPFTEQGSEADHYPSHIVNGITSTTPLLPKSGVNEDSPHRQFTNDDID